MRRKRYWRIISDNWEVFETRPTVASAYRLAVKLSAELGIEVFYHTDRARRKARRLGKNVRCYSVDVRRER